MTSLSEPLALLPGEQRDHHHRGQAPGPHHRDPSYALKCLLASDVCYRVMAPILQTTESQNTIIHFHPNFEPGRILECLH